MLATLACVLLICLRLQITQTLSTLHDYDSHRSDVFGETENVAQQHRQRISQIRPAHNIRHQPHFDIGMATSTTELPIPASNAVAAKSSNIQQHLHYPHQSKQKHTKSRLQPELDSRLHFSRRKTHNEHQQHEYNGVLQTHKTHTHKQQQIVANARTATTTNYNTITTGETEMNAATNRLMKPTSQPTHVTTKSPHTITLEQANKRSTLNYNNQPIIRQQHSQQLNHNHHKNQPKTASSEKNVTLPSVNMIHLDNPVKAAHFSHSGAEYYSHNKKITDANDTTSVGEHIFGTTSRSVTAADTDSEYADDVVEYYDYTSVDKSNANIYDFDTDDIGNDYDVGGIHGDDAEWPVNNLQIVHHAHSRHYQKQPHSRRQWHGHWQLQPERGQGEHSRVARDHHRVQSQQSQDNHLVYDEYADDEPYRDSSEQFSGRPGELTSHKIRELGTAQAAQHSRDLYLQRFNLVNYHINRMKEETRCLIPSPRVIHVSNDTSKTYVPPCTILYRCGEDAGCCRSKGQICSAKTSEKVPLYFFVIQGNSNNRRNQIEIVELRNDTECYCINLTDLTSASQNQLEERSIFEESKENGPNAACRCPRHFNIYQEDIRWESAQQRSDVNAPHTRLLNCRCDCSDTNTPCQKFKNGEEGFAMDDRRCIADKICIVPNCSFGIYNKQIGRCPRLISNGNGTAMN